LLTFESPPAKATKRNNGKISEGLVFLSSNALPRELIEQDWFRTIATVNPVSYLFEGLRSLVIFGWDGEALALGFAIAAVISLVGVLASAAALRTRVVRT
jgi:ABC-2 type transport system permease protein